MLFETTLKTERLLLETITVADNAFILELVNTEGWLKFIGDRKIQTLEDATAYIQKIIDNPNLYYWVVKLADNNSPIGIITFIKRDYLEYHDIGFAFLPNFFGKGYAHEATLEVLKSVTKTHDLSYILATTFPGNVASIKLLTKLGLSFEKEMEVGDIKVCVYGVATDPYFN